MDIADNSDMTGPPSKKVLSEAVEWQLLETVYSQTTTLIIGGIGLTAAAIFAWLKTHESWFLAWATGVLVVLLGRVLLDRAFRGRRARLAGLRAWRQRFIAGAWAMGALWGVAAFAISLPVGDTVRLLLVMTQIVLVMGTVTRSAGCPVAVKGQLVLALGPLVLVNIALRDTDHLVIAFFVLALAGATLIMLRNLNEQTVRLLCANEENLTLVRTVRQFNADLAAANLQLEEMATTDELTGIGNRRLFDDVLSQEVLRVRTDTNELSILMLDVDVFKGFNDLYGHQAGDRCLRRIAETLSATLPHGADVLARYGGEEFAAILPQTGVSAAANLAERMRADVEALAIPSVAGRTGTITVSIGVATFAADHHGAPEDYIHAADKALYVAKAAGRNCVRVAPSTVAR